MHPRPRALCFWLAFALLFSILALAEAGDWPRFRGPNGAGITADKDVPVKWTDDNVLWKTAIPGVGHSSPIVCKGRVFLQSASEDGKERWLLCLDAVKGNVLWKKPAPGHEARHHPLNSLASSTPATDGERVYTLFWNGERIHLSAFNFKDGKPLWEKDLGAFKGNHGFGHSPMVVDDKIIVANDQDGSAYLQAFNVRTGDKVWQTKRKAFRTCYSTPLVHVKPDGDKELIVASTAGISGYNPADGKENWWYTWKFNGKQPLRTVASPILASNLVLATAGDGAGDRHVIAVKLGGTGDVTSDHLAWQQSRNRGLPFPYVPCLLAENDYLFCANDKESLACYRAGTGETVWLEPMRRVKFTASPVLVDGKIYAVAENGTVYVFAAADKFHLLATNKVSESVFSSPAVADNRLFIRGENHLFCIGKPGSKRAEK